MKKFLSILPLAALILSGCSNFTQEMKDGASFANLDKVYVEQSSGLGSPFAVNASEINSQTKLAVEEFLKSKKYQSVKLKLKSILSTTIQFLKSSYIVVE